MQRGAPCAKMAWILSPALYTLLSWPWTCFWGLKRLLPVHSFSNRQTTYVGTFGPELWIWSGCWGKGEDGQSSNVDVWLWHPAMCTQDLSKCRIKLGWEETRDSQGASICVLSLVLLKLAWGKRLKKKQKTKHDPKAFQVRIKRLQVTKLADSKGKELINHFITLPFILEG